MIDATTSKDKVPLRKGALVRVNREAWAHSPKSGIRDAIAPSYIFEGPGEILAVRDNYGQIRWHKPVPDVWLCLDQLEPF